nr:uric acid degradation bifunctional protein TTL-like isoform X1 [Coffea arabica]
MGVFDQKDFLGCCGSTKFAKEMVLSGPFSNYQQAVEAARDIWFNKVDVNGWLEAFAAHPKIGESPSHSQKTKSSSSAQWSEGEQSTALASATDSSFQELIEWNARYLQKFGIVFLIFASGRTTLEILAEMKKRYVNRPIVELEIAAQEQMKITELRLSKLFSLQKDASSEAKTDNATDIVNKAGEDRISVIGGHLTSEASTGKPSQATTRSRPPITTHVLDVALGSPAAGIEVQLEIWEGNEPPSAFTQSHTGHWILQGTSMTDKDGRSGQLISMVDNLNAGIYCISFNTGKYNPAGFFPYVSIVFEVRESQKSEHFHVPLLLSPFSFSTYRGS